MDLSKHVPQFTWRTVAGGEKWIYDGELPVGALYAGTQPMGGIARPISLHDLRLVPGGPVFIARGEGCGPLCLSWRKHLIFQMAIDELKTDDRDPRRLKLYLKMHDVALRKDQPKKPAYQPSNVVEETWLEVAYDADRLSYVFDVRTRMTIQPGREQGMFARDFRGLEFGDILPAGANDRFPPRGAKKYHWLLYTGRDGKRYKLPQTHHLDQMHIKYPADGFLSFVAEAAYNPVVQFIEGSGLKVRSEVCWAMYDVHFKFIRDAQTELVKAGKPLEVHYQVFSMPERQARQWLADATLDPVMEQPVMKVPALFGDRVSRFEPSDEYRVPSDYWFWQRRGSGCTWDWQTGHNSTGSLAIARGAARGRSEWVFDLIGQGYVGLNPKGRHRVKAMVRTEGVTGAVRIAWQMIEPKHDAEHSRALTGTHDWTPLVIETADVPGARRASVRLILEGAGKAWFDDLDISPLQ